MTILGTKDTRATKNTAYHTRLNQNELATHKFQVQEREMSDISYQTE